MPLSHHLLAVLAVTTSSSGKSSGSSWQSFVPLILIVVVGYLLLVRPARNRQKRAMENRAAITPGVEVTTTAGMIATVVEVNDDDTVILEVAPGVHSRYVKGAIARVNTPVEPEPPTGEHEAITDPEAPSTETPPEQHDN